MKFNFSGGRAPKDTKCTATEIYAKIKIEKEYNTGVYDGGICVNIAESLELPIFPPKGNSSFLVMRQQPSLTWKPRRNLM